MSRHIQGINLTLILYSIMLCGNIQEADACSVQQSKAASPNHSGTDWTSPPEWLGEKVQEMSNDKL